ncbi:MAG: hypothetical protein ABIK92_16345 [Pseudomonadota bacterium]
MEHHEQIPILIGKGARIVDRGTFIVFIALVIWLLIDTSKRRELSISALCTIAGLSIFWQEFYADWGVYLLWSNSFKLMPWGSTLWTTPNKPWFVIVAYPLFMCFSIGTMLALCRKVLAKRPNNNRFLICLLTAGICLIAINTLIEYFAVSGFGVWGYVSAIGPALETGHALQPLLYPNIPFGIWGAVICFLILSQSANGRPKFESITKPDNFSAGWQRETARAIAWIFVWNVSYWLILCTPLIITRELLGRHNALVP